MLRVYGHYKYFYSYSAGIDFTIWRPQILAFNPRPAKLIYLNFHPLEVVSRYRDPQLQVDENYLNICLIWNQTFANLYF